MGGVPTVADLLLARAEDDHPGLRFGDHTWTWGQVVAESSARAAAMVSALGDRRPGPPHVGILLDNVPEYLFWLGGAALTGAAVVGINPTRRGSNLARDVAATDCRFVVTDALGAALLVDAGVDEGALLVVDGADPPEAREAAAVARAPVAAPAVTPQTLFLLLFTSGTTGDPKAVRCTQGRLAIIASRCVELYDFRRDDVCFCPMPLFHGNAVMSLWAPALAAGATMALAGRFSASRFVDDVRRHGATRFTYVGKALSYILETPAQPEDAHTSLRLGFGTEASTVERARFQERFGCRLIEGYGSSEGGIAINVVPGTPVGSLGLPATGDIVVVDPATGAECPRAFFDADGRLRNAAAAVGEIVNRAGAPGFEGYYADDGAEAERTRGGWYWSGDLGYRDEAGFFYFAGRSGDWLRVDSENFAAGPVERVLEDHPDVATCAVYPVPDLVSGDQVMAALVLRPGTLFDADAFGAFLADRPDLGTKWAPRFVRILAALPLTATGKPTKAGLRSDGWWAAEPPVFWRPGRDLRYRELGNDDRQGLHRSMAEHGRADLLGTPPPGEDESAHRQRPPWSGPSAVGVARRRAPRVL